MQLLYDLPIPLGEPHYAQMIKADKIKPINVYTPVGIESRSPTQPDPLRGRRRAGAASSARPTACTST